MADRNEADSPDESASSATPPEDQNFEERAIDKDALSPDTDADDAVPDDAVPAAEAEDSEADSHVAAESAREPTLAELEQMLEGDDPSDHDGADLDPDGEPAELADGNAEATGSDADGSADSDTADSDSDGSGDGELVSVGAAPRSRSKAAAAGGSESGTDVAPVKKAREKKDRSTPKQKQEVDKPKRTTPVGFVKEAVGELRKVVYPTAPQLGNYFVVVLVFVLFIIAFVGVLDLGFGWLIVKVFA